MHNKEFGVALVVIVATLVLLLFFPRTKVEHEDAVSFADHNS